MLNVYMLMTNSYILTRFSSTACHLQDLLHGLRQRRGLPVLHPHVQVRRALLHEAARDRGDLRPSPEAERVFV